MDSFNNDIIKIENLKVFAYHGIRPQERENGQNFYVNVSMYVKTRTAGLEDEMELATDISAVSYFIDSFMKEHTYKLLEAVTENLAEAILFEFPQIERIQLEVRKPEAPIGLCFESMSVKINRGWHTAYIAIGSNAGDREAHINSAIAGLKNDAKIRLKKISNIFETKPYGESEKKDFLNGALKLKTLYTPEELLGFLKKIELENGRGSGEQWESCTLDLDILFYDDLIMSTEELIIPHPDLTNRDFVLIPMAEIDPYAMHPIYHETVRMMLDKLLKSKEKFRI